MNSESRGVGFETVFAASGLRLGSALIYGSAGWLHRHLSLFLPGTECHSTRGSAGRPQDHPCALVCGEADLFARNRIVALALPHLQGQTLKPRRRRL